MDRKELSQDSSAVGKISKGKAQLLAISLKAVQSFEQGWRNIPAHVEGRHYSFWP